MTAAEATLYWSTTSPTSGWWVAAWRDGSMVRLRKVLRDGQHDSKPEQIINAAASVVPEVSEWKRMAKPPLRWVGEVAS